VKLSNSAVAEFWKMVISIFFLSWMKNSKQQKKIENGGKSTAASASSSEDSVPDMSPAMSMSSEK
jgi:hypothetical protein